MTHRSDGWLRRAGLILLACMALTPLLILPIANNLFSTGFLRVLASGRPEVEIDEQFTNRTANLSPGASTLCRMTSAAVQHANIPNGADLLTDCIRAGGTTGALARLALATLHRRNGNTEESIAILSGDANIERYLRHQARALLQDNQPETAIATLDMGGDQLRWPSSVMTVRADALRALDDDIAAEALYRESIELNQFDKDDPVNNLSRTLYNLGRLLESQRDWVEAEQVFDQLVQYNDANPNAWLRLAITQLSQGELESAEKSIKIAIEQDPRDWAFAYLGRIAFQQGDFATATESWWSAYLVEKNAQFLLEFARLDETEEVAALIRQFGRERGAQPEDYALLAKTLDDAGKTELAHMLLDMTGTLSNHD